MSTAGELGRKAGTGVMRFCQILPVYLMIGKLERPAERERCGVVPCLDGLAKIGNLRAIKESIAREK
jgi:hypothetical protein